MMLLPYDVRPLGFNGAPTAVPGAPVRLPGDVFERAPEKRGFGKTGRR